MKKVPPGLESHGLRTSKAPVLSRDKSRLRLKKPVELRSPSRDESFSLPLGIVVIPILPNWRASALRDCAEVPRRHRAGVNLPEQSVYETAPEPRDLAAPCRGAKLRNASRTLSPPVSAIPIPHPRQRRVGVSLQPPALPSPSHRKSRQRSELLSAHACRASAQTGGNNRLVSFAPLRTSSRRQLNRVRVRPAQREHGSSRWSRRANLDVLPLLASRTPFPATVRMGRCTRGQVCRDIRLPRGTCTAKDCRNPPAPPLGPSVRGVASSRPSGSRPEADSQ